MLELTPQTLYLGWQDRAATRKWFPVGRLDVDSGSEESDLPFRFRHVRGAVAARETGGFESVPGFSDDLSRDYRSRALFPVFRNRLMSPRRPDFGDYLRRRDLDDTATETEILAVDGGRRMTDFYEVFPKLRKRDDGSFLCRFFVHGFRHTNADSEQRIERLQRDERLHVSVELTNPTGHSAVQVLTRDYYVVGWAPRYFVHDLMAAMVESKGDYEARVVRVNPAPHPASQRLLIEMKSRWEKHEPMSGREFEPLAR